MSSKLKRTAKIEDSLENEDELRNEDNLRKEDNLKFEDDLHIAGRHTALDIFRFVVFFEAISKSTGLLHCILGSFSNFYHPW